MKEYKNIDRLFQEKFRDFEQNPSNKVWKNIENVIIEKPKRDKRAIWLWFSGIAAGLTLLFFMNSLYFSTTVPEHKITETDNIILNKNTNLETDITNTTLDKELQKPTTNRTHQVINNKILTKKSITTNITNTQQNTVKEIANNTSNTPSIPEVKPNKPTKNLFQSNAPIAILSNDNSNQNAINSEKLREIKKTHLVYEEQSSIKITKEKSSPIQNLESNQLTSQNKPIENTKKHDNKWIVSTMVAPVYLNAFDKKNSSIDSEFDDNIKQGTFSAAYGLQLAYQINNKFSVQTGVHLVDYGYKTYNIYVSPSGAVNRYSNINYNDNAALIDVHAVPMAQPRNIENLSRQESKGDLTQIFGYVEIPIEAKYNLNKGNFGINVIGGFSTLLLNKNEIYIETEEFSNKIGEASNLNSLNFSGNIGLELDYKVYKNVHFNLVPMFKVHTNTFEKNTNGFSPYAIGIYSGLNLRF
jgi:hypothetical protein